MRSKASYNGHPLHPALIPFPFAFLTGALVFDALGWLFDVDSWWTTGGHLAAAGVITALVAAVPGFIDYFYTVPPRSTGKQRATRHMLINLTAVALVAFAFLSRRVDVSQPIVVGVEVIAVSLLIVGGWMGGVLVSRNQIGVDHRYANAGKWKEATINAARGDAVVIGDVEDLKVNQLKLLRVGDRRIVLARDEDGYSAFDDRCTHRGGSLAGGTMICRTVQCPWHGSQFDVRTGDVKTGPAKSAVQTYTVEVQDSVLRLRLPS